MLGRHFWVFIEVCFVTNESTSSCSGAGLPALLSTPIESRCFLHVALYHYLYLRVPLHSVCDAWLDRQLNQSSVVLILVYVNLLSINTIIIAI